MTSPYTTRQRIMKLDEVNANNVLIPKAVVEEFLSNSYDGSEIYGTIKPKINDKPKDFSHKIVGLEIKDNYLEADIIILTTPDGQLLENMLHGDETASIVAQYIAETDEEDGVTVIKKITDINSFLTMDTAIT